ncbi:phytanoyl-coa dioxygenase, peroxisomal, partial [Plakobranchus ocellatus]
SISCHYASSKCLVLEKLEPEQRMIEEEFLAMQQKRFGDSIKFTFQDFWMMKSRHVKGESGVLS